MSRKKAGARALPRTEPKNETEGAGGDRTDPASSDKTPSLAELLVVDRALATDDQIKEIVNKRVAYLVNEQGTLAGYNVIFLCDPRPIFRSDANKIYQVLAGVDKSRPILLILRSPGGDIPAAYFIGKLCREYTTARFEVVVPREAKSAATLVCCGADCIHMGSLSELGPIDPQIGGKPALAIKHSLEHIAEIVTRHPGAKEMLSDYLAKALPMNVVGHFERAAGSAAQYAERLLSARQGAFNSSTNAEVARCLVYDYKDHGFAIDAREAESIFGAEMIKTNSDAYRAANELWEELDLAEYIVRSRFRRDLWFTGGPSDGCGLSLREEPAPSA